MPVGGLAAQVLDHPAGGVGLGGEGRLVAFFCQQGGFQLCQCLGAGILVIGLQLLGELADGGGEFLGLDAQLPKGTGSLQRADRPCGLYTGGLTGGGKSDRSRGENKHGGVRGMNRMAPKGAEGFRSRRMQQARPRDRRMG